LSRFLEILREKNRRIEAVPDALLTATERFQAETFRVVQFILRGVTTTGGSIDMTASNLAAIERIDGLLRQAMSEGEYFKAAVAFKNEMKAQTALTIEYFGAVTGGEVATAFGDALVVTRQAQALELILGSGVRAGFVEPLKDQLLAAVANNAGISTTLESLQTFILGNDQVDGRLLRYARTYASDIFATTDRAYTQVVADDLGLDWFLYTGGEMDTTRCFCDKRNGRYFHREEIRSWGRKENLGECNTGEGWAGMARGTNEDTIFTYVGGYNCQHSLAPVSVFIVPIEQVRSSIDRGYFKPSAAEKELLEL
jgi:hypothetical protein